MSRRKLQWWAACDGIALQGPYPTQEAAWRSLEAVEECFGQSYADKQATVHLPDARVWPAYDRPTVVTIRRGGA